MVVSLCSFNVQSYIHVLLDWIDVTCFPQTISGKFLPKSTWPPARLMTARGAPSLCTAPPSTQLLQQVAGLLKRRLLAQVISWRQWNSWVVAVSRGWFTLTGTVVAPLRGVSTSSKQEPGQLELSVNYTAQRQLSCLPRLLQAGPWQELPWQCYISTFAWCLLLPTGPSCSKQQLQAPDAAVKRIWSSILQSIQQIILWEGASSPQGFCCSQERNRSEIQAVGYSLDLLSSKPPCILSARSAAGYTPLVRQDSERSRRQLGSLCILLQSAQLALPMRLLFFAPAGFFHPASLHSFTPRRNGSWKTTWS